MGCLRWLCLFSLILLLQACSTLSTAPPQSVVERALAIKIAHTQQTLITHLAPKVPQLPNVKLRQVQTTLKEALDDDTFQVQGTYQATIQLTSQAKKDSGRFTLYIARETMEDTVSWFLVSDNHRELLVTNPV